MRLFDSRVARRSTAGTESLDYRVDTALKLDFSISAITRCDALISVA